MNDDSITPERINSAIDALFPPCCISLEFANEIACALGVALWTGDDNALIALAERGER